MSSDLIAHMRARVRQLRKVISLAHDQRMIDALQQVIDSGEADIKRLEEEADTIGVHEETRPKLDQ
ncbi:MAG TPA: hypothetical protein VHS33_10800 [Sphingomicrobium sp.]|jgi:predicted  nucleic acid-binding Zn-ribbon protein|nr:hypothetical protein [Sphingomicrobium sp.]